MCDPRCAVNNDFWIARWREKQIGFHQQGASPFLAQEYERFAPKVNSRVLVPLCGKSKDLTWLASRGHDVVGVELAQQAIDEYWAEEGKVERVQLIAADFFDVQPKQVGSFDWVFDRAALIAMETSKQPAYVQHLRSLIVPGGRIFLIADAYDQTRMSGPPFSVPEERVRWLFAGARSIEKLAEHDALEERFKQRGLDWMTETAYAINL